MTPVAEVDSAAASGGQLVLNGAPRAVADFDPNLSLLAYLRQQAQLTGTKEGCASGDCGACTVIVAEADGSGVHTVNSCITPLGHALGRQVVTVEGVGQPDAPHPVQQAMVAEHGSQCGFCTPGFVMSMVGAQAADPSAVQAVRPRSDHVRAISGNLCRCTGYRPILDAAAAADAVFSTEAPTRSADILPVLDQGPRSIPLPASQHYRWPDTEAQLAEMLREGGTLVAGSTDLWLAVTQQHQDFERLIDLTRIDSLRRIEQRPEGIHIGGAVTHGQLEAFFAQGPARCPTIVRMLHRFGSPQIRARGTIGGNLAGGSPIADWSPTLLATGATVTLRSHSGERSVPIDEFFLDYRRTAMADDEYLAAIVVSPTFAPDALTLYKISKREDDDISSVLGAFYLPAEGDHLGNARIAYGGVAATPKRLAPVEAMLTGQVLTEALIDDAAAAVIDSIEPISDVRATAAYRREVAANLLRKALLERFAPQPRSLDDWLADKQSGAAP